MKLVSFRVSTLAGPQTRLGGVTSAENILDLAAAYRLVLLEKGLTEAAAGRISQALIPGDMVAFIEGGEVAMSAAVEGLAWAEAHAAETAGIRQAWADLTLLPPVPRPPLLRDFMGFETHLKNIFPKLGREIPPEWYNLPVYYKGNAGSLGTHEQEVVMPSYAEELDFEFEFALVIGKGGVNISRERAMDHIFGYMIFNDFSARAIQSREMSVGLGPAKGKDFVGGHVFGPYLVTADEIPDIYNLRMLARINGQVWCDSNSSTIHWRLEDMIAHASLDEYLYPGEILGSGTVGNGSGAERGEFLQPGDVVELEIEGLGVLRNRVVQK